MELPSIDFTLLMGNNSEEQARLDEAAVKYGFFLLKNVPELSTLVLDSSLQWQAWFFSLPMEAKMSLKRSETNPFGYNDAELTKQRRDWKEILDIGPREAENKWPNETVTEEKAADFRSAMELYYEKCEAVSKQLIKFLLETKVGSQEEMESIMGHYEAHTSYLRLNHYSVCPNPAPEDAPSIFDVAKMGKLAVGRHTDAGAVTILLQDGVKGLQMEYEGKWTTICSKRLDLIINVGDMMQVYSNDRYKAPLHRVIASSTSERYSAPFFLNPATDSVIQPLALDQGSSQPLYKPISWREFRSLRALGDYKDAGEEVQIVHYRVDREVN